MSEQPSRSAPVSALDPGCVFEGLVVLNGPARIDGVVRGEIKAAALLWIGEAGRVEASVEAEEVVVEGFLEGKVRARSRIELLPSAWVSASLEAPRVRVAEGSHLEGHCRTTVATRDAPETPTSP